MSCRQYRDSRLSLATLTVTVTTASDGNPDDPGTPPVTATFQRLKLLDSCGRAAVCDGQQNDGYSATQQFFYNYPIFFHQPQLPAGLYFLLLAPVGCPCAVRVHGLVVGNGPDGNPWPVAGLEGYSNRCRQGQGLPYFLPTINELATGTDGKRGDPATITFARAVAGGPTTNEEQLVTLGPGNCFGVGSAVITNSVLAAYRGLGLQSPGGITLCAPGDLVTLGVLMPGVRITRETAGFRIGYFGAHGRQSIDLPTVRTSPASTLRSATIPQTGAEGGMLVTGVFDSGAGGYTLAAAAGCTGALGGTATSSDGSQTLTVSAA